MKDAFLDQRWLGPVVEIGRGSDFSENSVSVATLLVFIIICANLLLLTLYKDQDVGYQQKYADIQYISCSWTVANSSQHLTKLCPSLKCVLLRLLFRVRYQMSLHDKLFVSERRVNLSLGMWRCGAIQN
jgi:hypothetical protein